MVRALLMLVGALLTFGAAAQPPNPGTSGHYLFAWAGDQANAGNDFLIVMDADPASPSYGKLITSIATDQKSVRAHHSE
jgi:hypothetical protein